MDGDEVDLLCRTCHQKGNPEKVDSLMLGGEAFAEDPADDLSRSLRRQSVDTSQRGGRGDSLDSAADSDDSAAAETPSGAAPSQAERKRQKNRRAQTAYVERKRALTQSLESQLSVGLLTQIKDQAERIVKSQRVDSSTEEATGSAASRRTLANRLAKRESRLKQDTYIGLLRDAVERGRQQGVTCVSPARGSGDANNVTIAEMDDMHEGEAGIMPQDGPRLQLPSFGTLMSQLRVHQQDEKRL